MSERLPWLSFVVLAGGRSTRFGSDKAAALLGRRSLLEYVVSAAFEVSSDIVVVRSAGQSLPELPGPVRVVDDEVSGEGPLCGVVSGLARAFRPFVFATSTDAPLLVPSLVRLLAGRALMGGADVVRPQVHDMPQPLVAVYRRETCQPVFRDALESGTRRLLTAHERVVVEVVPEATIRGVDPQLDSFRSANTRGELDEIARLVEAREKGDTELG